ncbi:hypothetical protein [Planomonospora sp. ID82291]|uniref:hypothetical protein n=1 Tax=Planomonospora sp. ID82291 TaxID=2738136 RepID=UPI0018C40832|nr:hypothetical protein [Planomonospora sp. ID82291]MBG0818429.1 hypothetical protein [Planomonospora sp. ID82291]
MIPLTGPAADMLRRAARPPRDRTALRHLLTALEPHRVRPHLVDDHDGPRLRIGELLMVAADADGTVFFWPTGRTTDPRSRRPGRELIAHHPADQVDRAAVRISHRVTEIVLATLSPSPPTSPAPPPPVRP